MIKAILLNVVLAASVALQGFGFANLSPAQYERKFAQDEREYAECVIALERARAASFIPRGKNKTEGIVFSIIRNQIFEADCPQYKPNLYPLETS